MDDFGDEPVEDQDMMVSNSAVCFRMFSMHNSPSAGLAVGVHNQQCFTKCA